MSSATATGLAHAAKAIKPRRPRTRRGVELAMLVFAVLIALAAYADVGLARTHKVPPDMLTYGLGLGALVIVAHVAVRRFASYADPLLLPCAALLNGVGLVLIHRLDLVAPKAENSDATLQLAWTAIGVVGFIVVLIVVRDHRRLQRYTYTSMLLGVLLLAIPSILPARFSEVNGARNWIRFAGFSIQPGEFAKILLVVFVAGFLVAKRDALALASHRFLGLDLPRGRDLGPIIVAWLVSVGLLVRGRDLGMSMLFFGIFIVMLYIATERLSWLLIGLLLFVGGTFVAYHLFAHVRERFEIWLHPFRYAKTTGYQLVQGLYGFSSGGLMGTGLGKGRPDLVPFAKSDFIVSTIGEELGLTGLMAILLVYVVMVTRGLRASLSVRDSFGKLLAAGLAVSLAVQVFVVVGGVMRLIPLTGITTPFLSYGGSSLVSNWALIALLLRISDSARRPAPPPTPRPDDAATQVVRL
ncbi:MAG TPA: FtsW/RodA/SpoVE family cell cycle protein [Acidothermaceae bacterium]|nr:FtsW/RodA/SpoVE family cell cycle protein [Acidothermaceae bacterium]